jgi:hypothetical protein
VTGISPTSRDTLEPSFVNEPEIQRQRLGITAKETIPLSTARRWMRKEGFKYTHYSKALYYDCHERPDVVQYPQTEFLLLIRRYWHRLVRYEKEDCSKQLPAPEGMTERSWCWMLRMR